MLLDGEADAVDNGLDYIEVCEDMGLPTEEHRQFRQLQVPYDSSDSVIRSKTSASLG